MRKPIVTILMSAYNAGEYIGEAIESMLCQTFTDFEFIIINDASTDNTGEVIAGFNDSRIRYFRNSENKGLTKNLNAGLRLAKGEYIARMDADDVSLPNRLEMQVALMDDRPEFGLCGTWYTYFGAVDGKKIETITDPDLLKTSLLVKNQFGHPTVIMRKDVLAAHNLRYDESLWTSQDYNLWLRISLHTKVINLGQSLVKYRLHPGQVINIHKKTSRPFTHKARIKFFREVGLKVSQAEDEALHKSYFSESLNYEEFQTLRAFFDQLKAWNRKAKVYKESTLSSVVDQKLKQMLRYHLSHDMGFFGKGKLKLKYDPVGFTKSVFGILK